MVRHALDLLAQLLDVDRRTNQGREDYEREWPVTLSVPLTPMEADSLRFLSSLYPADPLEIARAAVLPFLDPGSRPPRRREDRLEGERTARVQLGLDEEEARALEVLSTGAGEARETVARWAMWDSLGPLLDASRP